MRVKTFAMLVLVVAFFLALSHSSRALDFPTLGPGVWSLRVTNPQGSGAKIYVRAYFNPNRPPWWSDTVYIGANGEGQEIPSEDLWLAEGQSSPWVDIGPHMSKSPLFAASPNYLSPVYLGVASSPEQQNLRLVAELALGTDHKLVRRIEVNEARPARLGYHVWIGREPLLPTLALLVPVDPQKSQTILTFEEAAAQQLEWIRSYGPPPKQPQHILFIAHQAQIAFKNPSRLQEMQVEIMKGLGYNNLTMYAADKADLDALQRLGFTPLRAMMVGRDSGEKEAQAMRQAGTWDYVRLANFGDEIDIDIRAPKEEQDRRFQEYLKGKGFSPMDFLRPEEGGKAAGLSQDEQWKLVHLWGVLPTDKPKLYYEAATFRYRLWIEEMAQSTAQIEKNFPPATWTGANYSPHLSVWPQVHKWIDPFKYGGMTMPWSEDWWWQVPEASPQSYGFLLDALRLAASYHNQPTCFYTITDPGETPEHLTRMNYFALAHQVKILDHFAIYHQGFGTCDYIDFTLSQGMYRAIRSIIGAVAQADDRLADARLRPAEVAILLPKASDIWDTEDLLSNPNQDRATNLYWAQLNVNNHERKAIWLALRHAQIPVDLITDEDVAEGRLASYRVLYVVGSEIIADAAPKLREWVRNGGIIFADGGGCMLDQYRRPLPGIYLLYGVRKQELNRATRTIGPSRDLPRLSPLDTVSLSGLPELGQLNLEALCYRQALTPGVGAKVVGTFADGIPAAILNQYGKGRILLIGALPGLAYLKPAMVDRKGLPESFPADLRSLIVLPTQWAGVKRQVVTSEPLVDATLMEGPNGAIVTLTNFRNDPIKELEVRLPALPDARRVVSVRNGELKVSRPDGIPTVSLPLEFGDFLLVE